MRGSRAGVSAAVMVLTALVTTGCGAHGAVAPSVLTGTPSASAVASSTPSAPQPPVAVPSPSSPSPASPLPSSPAPASAARRRGSDGADVLALQQRLVALGYWMGTERAPRGELRRYPGGHFTAYLGEVFENMVTDRVGFLRRHLTSTAAATGHG